MITMQTVLNQLTGTGLSDSLVQIMTEECAEFAAARKQYAHTMDILRAGLGEAAAEAAMDAIRQQTASSLLFCGALGIKANLDNFINPLSRNFLEVDPEIYLREETSRRMPEYASAQRVLDQFYASLSPDQRVLYEDIAAYRSHLETAVPKLAHYYGYLLGNELLPRIIPGYHRDTALTAQYQRMLRDYFGETVLLSFHNKFTC